MLHLSEKYSVGVQNMCITLSECAEETKALEASVSKIAFCHITIHLTKKPASLQSSLNKSCIKNSVGAAVVSSGHDYPVGQGI